MTMSHERGSRVGAIASLVEGIVGGELALGCSLSLDTTSFVISLLAATAAAASCTAVWAAATAGLDVAHATATAGLVAEDGVQQLNSGGLSRRG